MPRLKKPGQALTPLELEIMNALWETGPANVQTVQGRLKGRELAYTTVQTMLNILQRKGKVTRKLKDRAYEYRAVFSRQKAVTQAVGDVLNRFFGGSADSLVLNLVETRHLTREKLAQIQRLLEQPGRKDMETISRSLLTFVINSLWQIPLAAGVAAAACRFMRQGPASHRHAVWVAALAASLLVPLASLRTAAPAQRLEFPRSLAMSGNTAVTGHAGVPALPAAATPARTIAMGETAAGMVMGVYLFFVLCRLGRLGWAAAQTLRIRRGAVAAEIPLRIDRVRSRCQEAFGLSGVEILFSSRVSGPVAAGRTVILPESLLGEESDDVLTTAIGHEMAHIARRDFAGNLLYELISLPVSFHPAAWVIRRGIERTREMACDEMVTWRLMDAGVYARSIVSIAAQMTALPCPGYTLGVFDGDILEERIRRLVSRPAGNLKRARLALAGGLAALALCAVAASTLSFTARAQGAAADMMKQGQSAYGRGDYKTAAGLFQSAVQLDPNNLEAKLSLAHALLAQFVPGTDPNNPLVTGARQQYTEVLARDPGNKWATKDMMILNTESKQFAEAHQWAEKLIAVDATDKDGYYTAGFLDWSMTYPDYAAARVQAGMKPEDSGIIPDAGLRRNLIAQHGTQLDDGMRMFQTALQLDPGYSDAMAYMNLIYRIKAGIADNQPDYQALTAQADGWVDKALDAKRKQAANGRVMPRTPPAIGPGSSAPPPPPPPPPPPGMDGVAGGVGGGVGDGIHGGVGNGIGVGISSGVGSGVQRIRVDGAVQQANLLKQTAPVYPPAAAQAGVTGTVTLAIIVAKDGTVRNISVLKGHPLLVMPAIEAVKQWTYKPTLLNGEPVEVSTTVNVTFAGQ